MFQDAETGLKGAADAGGEENSDAIPALKDGEGEAEEEEEEEEDNNPFKPPESMKDYPLWLLSLPWYAAFTISIPDCSKVGRSTLQRMPRPMIPRSQHVPFGSPLRCHPT